MNTVIEPKTTATRTLVDIPVGQVFGVKAPAALTIPGWSQPGPLTPKANPAYVFRNGFLSDWLG